MAKHREIYNKHRNLIRELLSDYEIRNAEDLGNALKDIFAGTMEDLLEAELGEHLGYEKHEAGVKPTTNRRNGSHPKTIISHLGESQIKVPRDRDGSFEPQVVAKGQKDVSGIEAKILSMYGKGMSTRDMQDIIQDIYGVDLSPETITRIIDRIQPRIEEWQVRELKKLYTFVYVDALYVKVKEDGKARKKAVYAIVGIDPAGYKDVLGFWIKEAEGAHFWMNIFEEIRCRGVEDILFISMDGLSGLEEGLKSIFPDTVIQRCIVHLIRNSLKYIPSKHYKTFTHEARLIYQAVSLAEAKQRFEELKTKWETEYPGAVKVWDNNWVHVEQLFDFPTEIRRMMYTTNIIEGLNSALRKVTNGKAAFPNDSSVMKAFFLRTCDLLKKWVKPVANWAKVLNQLSVIFGNRITDFVH
jgi:transposase-like protein